MDIYPKGEAIAALTAYDKQCPGSVCAIDPSHRCNFGKCQYFVMRNVAVCKESRHTHVCTDECTFGLEKVDGTFCSLTGRQTKEVAVKQYLNKTKVVYGKKSSNQHWTDVKIKQPKTAAKNKRKFAVKKFGTHVKSTLHTLFLSKERIELTAKANEKQKETEENLLKTQAPSFALYNKVYECRLKNASLLNPIPKEIPEKLTKYLIDMVVFVEKQTSSKNTSLKRTGHSVILGLIELLQSGFVVEGCELVSPSPFLKKYAPDVTQVGKLPNIRARQQTIATRLVKLALVTSSGEPLRRLPKCPV